MKNDERFEMIWSEGSSLRETGRRHILVDKETGINYLFHQNGNAGGMTPLLDRDGKPVITSVPEED